MLNKFPDQNPQEITAPGTKQQGEGNGPTNETCSPGSPTSRMTSAREALRGNSICKHTNPPSHLGLFMNPSGDSRSIDGGSLSGRCPSLPPVQEGDRSYTGNGSINSCPDNYQGTGWVGNQIFDANWALDPKWHRNTTSIQLLAMLFSLTYMSVVTAFASIQTLPPTLVFL